VIEAALRNPERYAATIALSPVDAEVTPLTPRNLQLQAGGREPAYLANAEMLLESAGGPSQDFAAGRARELVTIPAAGHIDILMRSPSHAAAVGWLDRALEADPTLREPYTDRRMLGWLLQIIGWMVVVSSMAVAYEPPDEHRLREPWYPAAAALSPLVATLIFAVVANLVDLSRLFGVLIGGGVGIWMLLAGGLYLAFGARLPMPVMLQWVRGGVLFVILWVIIGLSGEFVWMDWGLSGRRLMLFPLFALMSIPWFTAAAAVQEESGRRRWIVWMVHTVALVAGLWLLGLIAPGMTLVNLILPLIVLFYSVLAYMTTRFNDPWVAGIGCGAFWGWLLASAFPIVG